MSSWSTLLSTTVRLLPHLAERCMVIGFVSVSGRAEVNELYNPVYIRIYPQIAWAPLLKLERDVTVIMSALIAVGDDLQS